MVLRLEGSRIGHSGFADGAEIPKAHSLGHVQHSLHSGPQTSAVTRQNLIGKPQQV